MYSKVKRFRRWQLSSSQPRTGMSWMVVTTHIDCVVEIVHSVPQSIQPFGKWKALLKLLAWLVVIHLASNASNPAVLNDMQPTDGACILRISTGYTAVDWGRHISYRVRVFMIVVASPAATVTRSSKSIDPSSDNIMASVSLVASRSFASPLVHPDMVYAGVLICPSAHQWRWKSMTRRGWDFQPICAPDTINKWSWNDIDEHQNSDCGPCSCYMLFVLILILWNRPSNRIILRYDCRSSLAV